MVEGFIDSASAYEIVLVLARRSPRQSFKMEWDRALEVTATLINTDRIKLAPSPRREGAASGPYGVLLEGLESAVSRIVLPEEVTAAAIRKTKKWAGENVNKLRLVLSSFTDAPPASHSQAAMWLDSHIHSEWHEHVLRRGSLFDRDFALQIAKVLDLPESDVLKLWSLTTDASFVAELAARMPDTDVFHLIRDAFTISALLRGRYHDYAAESSHIQILSHPVREPILRKTSAGRVSIEVSNTERYLANIAVAASFAERSHEARVALWVDNVLKLRRGRDQINLGQKDRDETARDTALDAARKFDIRIHSKLLETFIDAGLALGSTALTSFVLLRWESMLAGSGIYALSRKKNLGGRVAAGITSATGKLDRLSRLAPGRIKGGEL